MSELEKSPPATSILLVRHAESEGNRAAAFGGHSDMGITGLGQRQALATAEWLQKRYPGVRAIHSSDLRRAVLTAEPIARAYGLPVRTTPDLRERDVGVFTGMTFEEAKIKYPGEFAKLAARDPASSPPGGESHHQVFERVCRALDAIVREHPGEQVVVVSHALALFHIFRRIFGLDSHGGQHKVFLYKSNCGVSLVEWSAGGFWKVRFINETAFLDDMGSRHGFEWSVRDA